MVHKTIPIGVYLLKTTWCAPLLTGLSPVAMLVSNEYITTFATSMPITDPQLLMKRMAGWNFGIVHFTGSVVPFKDPKRRGWNSLTSKMAADAICHKQRPQR